MAALVFQKFLELLKGDKPMRQVVNQEQVDAADLEWPEPVGPLKITGGVLYNAADEEKPLDVRHDPAAEAVSHLNSEVDRLAYDLDARDAEVASLQELEVKVRKNLAEEQADEIGEWVAMATELTETVERLSRELKEAKELAGANRKARDESDAKFDRLDKEKANLERELERVRGNLERLAADPGSHLAGQMTQRMASELDAYAGAGRPMGWWDERIREVIRGLQADGLMITGFGGDLELLGGLTQAAAALERIIDEDRRGGSTADDLRKQDRWDRFAAAALTGVLSQPWHPAMNWSPLRLDVAGEVFVTTCAKELADKMVED